MSRRNQKKKTELTEKIIPVKYARKPFYVDVVEVSENNMEMVANWCEGTIKTEGRGENARRYIKVSVQSPMNERQTKAFAGDFLLHSSSGFKVYTPKAFEKSFDKVRTLTKAQADEAGIHPPIEKRKGMPKDIMKSARVHSLSLDKEPNAFGESVHVEKSVAEQQAEFGNKQDPEESVDEMLDRLASDG